MKIVTRHQNAFDLETVPTELISIITSQVAPKEVAMSLNGFLELARQNHEMYMNIKLSRHKSRRFWDAEKRVKVYTFADMRKSVQLDKSTKIMTDSEVLFRRLLAVSKKC